MFLEIKSSSTSACSDSRNPVICSSMVKKFNRAKASNLYALKTYFLVSFGFAISKALITSFETVASLSVAFSALSRASLKKLKEKDSL